MREYRVLRNADPAKIEEDINIYAREGFEVESFDIGGAKFGSSAHVAVLMSRPADEETVIRDLQTES